MENTALGYISSQIHDQKQSLLNQSSSRRRPSQPYIPGSCRAIVKGRMMQAQLRTCVYQITTSCQFPRQVEVRTYPLSSLESPVAFDLIMGRGNERFLLLFVPQVACDVSMRPGKPKERQSPSYGMVYNADSDICRPCMLNMYAGFWAVLSFICRPSVSPILTPSPCPVTGRRADMLFPSTMLHMA